MAYQKKKTNRISDPNRINYVKSILEASVKQCQEASMHTPEVYIATAQRMADTYSDQNANYPRITFGTKEQKIRGQENPVTELTATIGEQTSTSYFLLKDSLPQGTKASQEQLTFLRPDIVSARIAASLGIVQTPPTTTIPPIGQAMPGQGIPNPTSINPPQAVAGQTLPTMSKAQMMAQTSTQQQPTVPAQAVPGQTPAVPPQTQVAPPNPLTDGFAALATGAVPAATQNMAVAPNPYQTQVVPPVVPEAQNVAPQATPPANRNPYATMETEDDFVVSNGAAAPQTTPPVARIPINKAVAPSVPPNSPVEPIRNPQMSQTIKEINRNLQAGGNLNQRLGQALKDMAKGEINPIQLYGDTLNIIGNFMNGIPAGMHEARLKKISEQMKLVTQKKTVIELKMDRVGNDLMLSETTNTAANPATTTPEFKTSPAPVISQTAPESKSEPEPEAKTNPVIVPTPAPTQSSTDRMTEAIDKLLKSNASMDDKLDAIEKTLDKMLEKLSQIELNLEAIQATLEANSTTQASQGMVVETEAKTEVEVVANDPEAEVATRTEIDTDLVADARIKTEAAKEVEVPEVTVDSVPDESEPDIGQELAKIVSSYEGNLDKLNQHLQQDNLRISISEAGDSLSVSEVDNGIVSLVFSAEANGEGCGSFKVKFYNEPRGFLVDTASFYQVRLETYAFF